MPHPTSLTLFSLNIQVDRHYDRIITCLKEHKPDIVLMQEVLKNDLPYLEHALNMNSIFTVMVINPKFPPPHELGLAIFSSLPIHKQQHIYYKKDESDPLWLHRDTLRMPRALQIVEISKIDKPYTVMNTHFTWTPDGKPTQEQHQDLQALLKSLSHFQDFILCGDFNAPRGTAIFDKLASQYKDNIPAHAETTIDKKWHKAGDLNLVVDGCFTTPKYHVDTLQLIDNVSDHYGILAKVHY